MGAEGQNNFNAVRFTATGQNFSEPCTAWVRVDEPEITDIEWVRIHNKVEVPTRWENANEIKYGTEARLRIRTEGAFHCFALVIVRCNAWRTDFVGMAPITKRSEDSEETIFSFIPRASWLREPQSTDASTMTAKVYLVYDKQRRATLNESELRQMAQHFEDGSNDDWWRFPMGYENRFVIFYKKESEREIPISKIVIVIDPGHGWDTGNTGTECRQFVYYGRDENGERDTSSSSRRTATAFDLPDYVLQDVEHWINRFIDIPDLDMEYQEWFYVIDVSLLLKAELERSGEYRVLLTREVEPNPEYREQIAGTDTMTERYRIPNNNNADYFISVHCDGQEQVRFSGAFVLFPRNIDAIPQGQGQDIRRSRILGQDILRHYTALNVARDRRSNGTYIDTVRQPGAPPHGKRVLMNVNRTQRRVLVELGRMTNPNDILGLYQPNIQQTMAENLAQGIIFNITNRFADE